MPQKVAKVVRMTPHLIIMNALHVLKKPLVAKMQMDHSLNPMFQCPLKFLSLSQSMHIRDGSSGGGFAEES